MFVNIHIRKFVGVDHSHNRFGAAVRGESNVFDSSFLLQIKCELVDSVFGLVQETVDLVVVGDTVKGEQIDVFQSTDIGPLNN